MQRRQTGSNWVLAAGILIAILGMIHNAATKEVYYSGYDKLPLHHGWVFIYMFLLVGTAVVFAGGLVVYCSFGLRRSERWSWSIALGVGVFMVILVSGAVMVMPGNLFAYIGLALALMEILPLIIFHKEFTNSPGSKI
jgi:magnesium-transporting ATPase (P-type)